MTPRKEIFIAVKQALKDNVAALELVDLQRKQFLNPKENYGNFFTAALIKVKAIKWESMTEQKQEGTCVIDVTFYCKDGWLDQHDETADDEHGLPEIDVIDAIVETLQFLKGDYFTQLELSDESDEDTEGEMMSYTLSFTTNIYRRINPKFQYRKLTLNP